MITIALMAMGSSSVLAHGPECHLMPEIFPDWLCPTAYYDEDGELYEDGPIDLCKESFLDDWFKTENLVNSAACNPDNPPNISAGITREYGSYPFGLCYPSFNNYIDSSFWSNNDQIYKGWDPFKSYPPIFENEQNFFQYRIVDDTPKFEDYGDGENQKTIEVGDEIIMAIFIHNNGDPCFNDNNLNNIPGEKFYSDWNTTSHDTKLSVIPGFYIEDGIPKIKIDENTNFSANIWSKDAIHKDGNSTSKSHPTSDDLTINVGEGQEFILEYVDDNGGTALYIDHTEQYDKNGEQHNIDHLIADLLSEDGMDLSSFDGGSNIKGEDGDYYGCQPYIGVITFRLKVTEPPVKNYCEYYNLEPFDQQASKVTINGETAYKLPDFTLNFTDGIPEGTQILWSTSNMDMKFYSDLNGTEIPPVEDEWATAQTRVVITDLDQNVYVSGIGQLLTTVINTGNDGTNQPLCHDKITIVGEEITCDSLKVDHPTKIYTGTVSKLSAKAYSEDDSQFESQITYWVDPGYGYFTTDYPTGIPKNPSIYFYETFEFNYEEPVWDTLPDGTDVLPGYMIFYSNSFTVLNNTAAWDIANQSFWGEGEQGQGSTMPLPGDDLGDFGDFGINSVAHALYLGTGDGTLTPDGTGFGTGPGTLPGGDDFQLPEGGFSPLLESITVDQGTPVFFVALKPGENKLHVKAISAAEGICEKDFDILELPKEEFPVCEDLKVNYPSEITVGMTSEISAIAFDDSYEIYNGQITYVVDPEYGEFYLEPPVGTINPADVIGFNPSFTITTPPGGFCTDGTELTSIYNPFAASVAHALALPPGNGDDTGDQGGDPDGTPTTPDPSLIGSQTVTVDPGTKVYFYAKKLGTNVIEINTNCTEEDACNKYLSTWEPPLVCKEAVLNVISLTLDEFSEDYAPEDCITEGKSYYMWIDYTDSNNEPIPLDKIKVKWTTTDPEATFQHPPYSMFDILWDPYEIENPSENEKSFIGGPIIVYQGGGQVRAELWELDGKPFTQNVCKAQIDACPEENKCKNLKLIHSITQEEIDSIEFDPNYSELFEIIGKDINNNPLPDTTKLKWTTDTGAKLSYHPDGLPVTPVSSETGEITNKISEKTWFSDLQNKGYLTVEMADTQDPLYSAVCKDILEIIDVLVCEDLTVTNKGTALVNLVPGEVYELQATATYSSEIENPTVTFTSTQGVFYTPDIFTTDANQGPPTLEPINEAPPTLEEIYNIVAGITAQSLKGTISSDYLTDPNISDEIKAQLSTSVIVPEGTTVYFITFNDAAGTDALIVQATGRSEAVCIEKFHVIIPETACKSISVVYYPSPFDATQSTVISVQKGDFGDFEGNFLFETEHGTFYTPGNEPGSNPAEFSIADSAAGVVFSGGQTGDSITIKAVGLNAGANCNYTITETPEDITCEDLWITTPSGRWEEDDFTDDNEQKFVIDVDTNPSGLINNFKYDWEVTDVDASFEESTTDKNDSNPLINYLEDIDADSGVEVKISAYLIDNNGNKIEFDDCVATKKLKTEKVTDEPEIEKVVYDPNDKDWTTTINVGGKNKYGNLIDSKYEYITYIAVFDPGDAKEVEIWEKELNYGSIDSDIKQGELNFTSMVIAVEDGNKNYIIYKDSGFKRTEFKNEDEIIGDDIEDFDEYFGSNEDFEDLDNDDLEDEFDCSNASSKKVCIEDHSKTAQRFQDGNKITLKNIDEADKIYFIYQMKNDTSIDEDFCIDMIEDFGLCGEQFDNEINFKTDDDDGEDDARVIVICPYILAREGGDVFFHSAIETGVDISACYEVETCEGPCITPEPEPKPEGPGTGPGDIPVEGTLVAPSHDICKLSNTEDLALAEEYRNVFKHFSSSVCEMKTEVAEDWKEKYINEAIEANVEKLARFGESEISDSFSNVDGLAPYMTNGVLVTTGDITIDNGSSDFLIQATDSVPAAQTYILKGGTLTINSNITYNDNFEITDPTNIPSVAFIVIDGNIEISPNVTKLDGIYMAIDTEDPVDGQINSIGDEISYEILTIRGSLIGDVYNLFLHRKGIGDPLKDESSITVKYDERILLNTPPGLTALIDISQLKVAN
jgi:hypothetical protein